MPRLDLIHNSVKTALASDGWLITDDPYTIEYGEVRVFADLAAERTLAAEREGRKIAVEIKSFIGASLVHELENAIGQYLLYRGFLQKIAPERKVYIAISDLVYEDFFEKEGVRYLVELYDLSLIIVNLDKEVITQWIN